MELDEISRLRLIYYRLNMTGFEFDKKIAHVSLIMIILRDRKN